MNHYDQFILRGPTPSNYHFRSISRSVYCAFDNPSKLYPRFDDWYFHKFLPGVINGSRTIIIFSAKDIISGIALLKCEEAEKKICRLEVTRKFRRANLGKHLFEKSFEMLNTDHPSISISDDCLPYFSHLLNFFGFQKESEFPGYYRHNSSEHVFNGIL